MEENEMIDYEKKYNEALERARYVLHTVETAGCAMHKDLLTEIFPELAESEDERIRKFLIKLVNDGLTSFPDSLTRSDVLTYLEKQKESLHISKTCKENADSFIDDVGIRQMLIDHFTRYKIGNMSTKLNGFLIDDIIAFVKNQKEPNARQRLAEWSKTEEGKAKYEAVAKEMREEMEKEQKPAERFEEARGKYQVEWKLPEDFEEAVYRVANFISPFDSQDELRRVSPRFAEQLMSLAKKGLVEKPAEWSEEDKKILDDVSHILIGLNYKQIAKDYKQAVEKLIYARPSWKPSEEQMKELDNVCHFIPYNCDILGSLYDNLKKLM